MNIFNTKSKIIAGIVFLMIVTGSVVFAFRDEFLSDKSLYLKIEKENIEMLTEKLNDIKEEDLLGMFFVDGENKAIIETNVALNISADSNIAGKMANFVNPLKLSIIEEQIQKEEYRNKKISFLNNQEEIIDISIVNDGDTLGLSSPKLYDKWIVTDMSLAEVVAGILKSDEGAAITNTLTIGEVKSALELTKTEKQDFTNAISYHLDKLEKALSNANFTKISDTTFVYDKDNEIVANSIKIELSEIETLARLSQILTKSKESGQLIELAYNKVGQIKNAYGENNVITDKIPEKQEVLSKVNEWIDKIDARLLELNIEDVSVLFDEEDNFIGVEGTENNYYSMIIYYDNDYRILNREIYISSVNEDDNMEVVSDYQITLIEDEFYMIKKPDEVWTDKVEKNGEISIHNLAKSYYKESYSFEGFKFNKVPKWVEAEEVLKIEIDSNIENQKNITIEMPSIKSFKFFADISREEINRNEINVISKVGIDIKGERQYLTIEKNITRKADVEKVDIYANSIDINEETQEKVSMIADVVKGNTDKLALAIEEKTGVNLTETFKIIKEVPQKIKDIYETLNTLGIIGN